MEQGKRKESEDKRSKAAYYTAIIAFVGGWGMTIAGFCVPPVGDVSGSVIAVLGEAMVYAASVFGVTLYFKNQLEKFRADTRKYYREEIEPRDTYREYSDYENE